MTEQKRNPNPFIRLAQQAKQEQEKHAPTKNGVPSTTAKAPKPTKGFGGKVMRKTGRGG